MCMFYIVAWKQYYIYYNITLYFTIYRYETAIKSQNSYIFHIHILRNVKQIQMLFHEGSTLLIVLVKYTFSCDVSICAV
jgi:hypothetical protein